MTQLLNLSRMLRFGPRMIGYGLPLLVIRWFDSVSLQSDLLVLLAVVLFCELYYRARFPHPGHWLRLSHVYRMLLRSTAYGIFAFSTWWALTSAINAFLRPAPVPKDPKRFELAYDKKRFRDMQVSVALSGGGYRAALFHAGVLQELEGMGARPHYISAVSGGSIIGAYYALGGTPARFVKIVGGNRYNLSRFAFDIQNFSRLAGPWYSRTNLQADLLDSIFFDKAKVGAVNKGASPEILFGTTDLKSGLSIGWSPRGYTLYAVPGWIRADDLSGLSENLFHPLALKHHKLDKDVDYQKLKISHLVAASGAFPLAFTPVEVPTKFTSKNRTGDEAEQPYSFSLADGALLDNSGLSLLLAHIRVTETSDDESPFSSQPDDSTDLIIESDASSFFENEDPATLLQSIYRPIDVMHAETQFSKRLVNQTSVGGEKEQAMVRVSPHMFFMPKPLVFPEVLKDIHVNLDVKRDPRSKLSKLKERLDAWIEDTGKDPAKDRRYLLDYFQEYLIEYKIRQAITEARFETLEKMLQVLASHSEKAVKVSKEVVEDAHKQFLYSTLASHSQIRVHSPRFLWIDPDEESVPHALSAPMPEFSSMALEDLYADIFECLKVYKRLDTLKDRINHTDAASVYRLGRYVTLLQQDTMENAAN